jgi:hypothetical protein
VENKKWEAMVLSLIATPTLLSRALIHAERQFGGQHQCQGNSEENDKEREEDSS